MTDTPENLSLYLALTHNEKRAYRALRRIGIKPKVIFNIFKRKEDKELWKLKSE